MKKWKISEWTAYPHSGKKMYRSLGLLLAVMPLTIFAAGCGQKDFDAASWTSACLDGILKGDDEAARKLSGDQADAESDLLASIRSQLLSERVSLSLGNTGEGPGNVQLSPEIEQDYTTLWEDIFAKTDYSVASAEKKDDTSYQVTLSTKQLQLYDALEEILPEALQEYSETMQTADEENGSDQYTSIMLEAYQKALDNAAYNNEEGSAQITLSQTEDDLWTIQTDDINTLLESLLDLSVMDNGLFNVSPEDAQTEASPNTTVPEISEDTVAASIGETVSMEKDSKVLAEFSIDQVEVTDARSPYDTSNPEKVIVITYTYTNTGSEDPLLFDEMSFTVTEGESACSPYYLDDLQAADIAQKGQGSVTASLAYGVSSACTNVTIHVNNPQLDTPIAIDAPVV